MSETSRTNDSAPSLSSYPPAFVSLITTFIQRAEEAETRAHKALMILRSKDQQVLQLQQRVQTLEQIASKLEEVMVPPLELPESPQSTDDVDGYHPRNVEDLRGRLQSNNHELETLYERYPTMLHPKDEPDQVVHNCYTRCQYLIDGLERSNGQLREALAAESQQRVKDHEQYVATLAKVSHAVKELQAKQSSNNVQLLSPENKQLQAPQEHSLPKTILEDITSILAAAGLTKENSQINEEIKQTLSMNASQMALSDKDDLKRKLDMAENIIQKLKSRLESGEKKCIKRIKPKSRKVPYCKSSTSTTSSYHTQQSIRFKPKLKYRSLYCFFNELKRKNKKLKTKHQNICEKFKNSLKICEKLQEDIVSLTKQNNMNPKEVKVVEKCTQTKIIHSSQLYSGTSEKVHSSQSVHILQGRLEAAAKVMTKQHKQIQDLQHQLVTSHSLSESLKKRLFRSESMVAGKELLGATASQQLEDAEIRNSSLAQQIQKLTDSLGEAKQELISQIEVNNKIKKEKEAADKKFEDMKMTLETKLCSLSSMLQEKDEMSSCARSELETKLSCLREQLVTQVTEASTRLVAANNKIQELYLGIETFFKLLFTLKGTSNPDLSPASQAQAVEMASDILQLAPGQIQTILHSSRYDNYMVNKWIRECNRLIHKTVFAKDLGHLLLDAILENGLS